MNQRFASNVRRRMVLAAIFGILCLLMAAGHGMAQPLQPMDTLKKYLDAVFVVLEDARFKAADSKDRQRKEIIAAAQGVFDFVEIAKRSLARKWKLFTPSERKTFTGLFASLLKEVYSSKIQSGYDDQRVTVIGQKMVTAKRALVKTELASRKGDLPIDYSMRWQNHTWKVYDVRIEGVSLVQNYRAQFGSYLLNKEPAELIDRLRKKVAQFSYQQGGA